MRLLRFWRGWVPILMILVAAEMAILPWTAAKILAAVLFTALIVMVLGGVFNDWERLADVEKPPPRCRVCGYDLRASKERCPECGTAIEPGEALVYSPMLSRVLERAEMVAREMGVEYVGTEHVLEAMFSEPESVAGVILESAGVEKEEVREWTAVVSNRVVAVE